MAHLAASPSVQGPDACVRGTHPLGRAPNLGQVLGHAVVSGRFPRTRFQLAYRGLDACVRGTHPLDAPNLGQVLGTPLSLGHLSWTRLQSGASDPRDAADVS